MLDPLRYKTRNALNPPPPKSVVFQAVEDLLSLEFSLFVCEHLEQIRQTGVFPQGFTEVAFGEMIPVLVEVLQERREELLVNVMRNRVGCVDVMLTGNGVHQNREEGQDRFQTVVRIGASALLLVAAHGGDDVSCREKGLLCHFF